MPAQKTSRSGKPYCRLMTVTPERAKKWLDTANTANRKMNKSQVNLLAREIQRGKWQAVPHQCIAFDTNGVLIDGQKRLQSIVDSEQAVQMYVWFNVPTSTRAVTDRGTQRSLADVATLDADLGMGKVGSAEVAVMRAMCGACQGNGQTKMTDSEELESLIEHRSAVAFAREHMKRAPGGMKGIASAVERAVIARAYYSADDDDLAAFCDDLVHGNRRGGNGVIGKLWDRLLVNAYDEDRRKLHRPVRYGLVERALYIYLNGERVSKLHPTSTELFPLPGESAAKPSRLMAAQ